jgi:glycogen(starch) synthase
MILRRMSMPTRVLAVGNAYPPHHLGGYEIAWRGVMSRLQAEGHAVRILTTDYRRDDVTGTDAEDPDVRRELDWYWREHQWRSLRPLARLALERHNAAVLDHQLRSFRPDVITWWPVGGLGGLVCPRCCSYTITGSATGLSTTCGCGRGPGSGR